VDLEHIFSGRHVLVTGGAGALGSKLVERLAGFRARVHVIDDLSASPYWNVPHAAIEHFIHGDILDRDMLEMAFEPAPAFIFHLAASFANLRSLEDPERDLLVNGLGTLRLLERASRCNIQRLVYASSSCVYGNHSLPPFVERAVSTHLATPYQASKLLGELYCNCYHQRYRVPTVNVRIFNCFGPGEIPGVHRNVIPRFIYRALREESISIYGTGNETRDFTFVDDVVEGLLRAAAVESAIGCTFNLGSGVESRIVEVARTILQLTGSASELVYLPARSWDSVQRRSADISTARSVLGFSSRRSLEDGLAETVSWFRQNWACINDVATMDHDEPG
jgi:nucleoside-diphosphate-sugar epimerase